MVDPDKANNEYTKNIWNNKSCIFLKWLKNIYISNRLATIPLGGVSLFYGSLTFIPLITQGLGLLRLLLFNSVQIYLKENQKYFQRTSLSFYTIKCIIILTCYINSIEAYFCFNPSIAHLAIVLILVV